MIDEQQRPLIGLQPAGAGEGEKTAGLTFGDHLSGIGTRTCVVAAIILSFAGAPVVSGASSGMSFLLLLGALGFLLLGISLTLRRIEMVLRRRLSRVP